MEVHKKLRGTKKNGKKSEGSNLTMKEIMYQGKKVNAEPVNVKSVSGGYAEVTLESDEILTVKILILGVYKELDKNEYLVNHQVIVEKK